MIQLSYNGELYSYDNKTSTTVSSSTTISVLLHPYVDIEGAKLFYSQGDTEGTVDITNNEAGIPGAYLVTGDLQIALKLASNEMSNTFTINVTKISSSGDVTDDDIQFTMDNKKRLILVPGSQNLLAIQFDNQSEIVTFKFPRYQEGVDLSTKIPYVNYKRPQMEDLGKALCTIEEVTEDTIYFSWVVDEAATQYEGIIQFQVEFTDSFGYRWQSQVSELPILVSLYNTGLEPYSPGVLEQYLREIQGYYNAMEDALDGALIARSNVTASGSGDFRDSLSKPGMYFKFSGEVTGGVNAHSARILLFRSPNDEYGKLLVWVDGVTGSVYTCVYRGPATGTWTDWVQLPSMGEVTDALATKYSKPSGGIPASDLAEAVHNVLRNAVGSKPTYTITIDTENGNAVTGPNYKWIVVSSYGGEPEVGAEFRIETVADGEITWSSTESVKYQVSGNNSVVIIGWKDRSELEGNPAEISGITRRYYAVSATISGNSVVYSYLGSFSSDLALMDDVAVRSFSKTSVDGHYVFNIGYLESGPLGDMETTGTIYPATETYRKDEVDTALAGKLGTNMGAANAGKFLVVGNDGVVVPVTMSAWQGGNY